MVTLAKIREAVKACVFNPKESGPLKIIVEMNDSHYCMGEAIRLITEAKNRPQDNYDEKITRAISLLVLAKAMQ